jgi:arylsulfatase A-like enzyme
VFIMSDHGEAFGEHGTTSHGSSIYNEQVRIPLIVKPPRGTRLSAALASASLLDVSATIAGIAGRDGFGIGRDLRLPAPAERAVGIDFKGTFRRADWYGALADHPARAVVRGHFKLLERGGTHELYDLTRDPRELEDRGAEYRELVRSLAADLPQTTLDAPTQTRKHSTRDQEQEFRSLGYVQ